jgi:hypothetical protein
MVLPVLAVLFLLGQAQRGYVLQAQPQTAEMLLTLGTLLAVPAALLLLEALGAAARLTLRVLPQQLILGVVAAARGVLKQPVCKLDQVVAAARVDL